MSVTSWKSFLFIIVILLAVSVENCFGITCEFCNQDFKILSKHTWRCKARVENYERVSETSTVGNKLPSDNLLLSNSLVSLNSANNNVDKCNKDFDPHENEKKECVFTCYFGREFKTLRGLNVHKRSCDIFDVSEISNLLKETVEETGNESDVDIDTETLPKSLLKPGVKLPKSDKEWERANDFFRHNLIGDPENPDIHIDIANFQSLLYDFFSNSYGTVNDTNREFDQKYTNSTKSELKKTLKQLKLMNTPPLQKLKVSGMTLWD